MSNAKVTQAKKNIRAAIQDLDSAMALVEERKTAVFKSKITAFLECLNGQTVTFPRINSRSRFGDLTLKVTVDPEILNALGPTADSDGAISKMHGWIPCQLTLTSGAKFPSTNRDVQVYKTFIADLAETAKSDFVYDALLNGETSDFKVFEGQCDVYLYEFLELVELLMDGFVRLV